MTRKRTTVLIDQVGCAGGTALSIEHALRNVPGVMRAYVNPVTEAAYVEFDADRCGERDLARAIESFGLHVVSPSASPTGTHPLHARHAMPASSSPPRLRWAFAGFLAIAMFFLLTEHRAHLFGALPFLLLLACPLLHVFGHGGHGGHAGHSGHEEQASRARERASGGEP